MLHAENLKALYLKSPTSWRINWWPCLVNSKEISVDFLKSILMKAKLPVANCYPWTSLINMFFVVSSSSTCLLSILLKYENERLKLQFSSVAQSCPTLCDPMDCSRPGFPVLHQLPELTQTHVHWVSDAIQPSHPLSSPSPPAFNLSQHQGLFKWVSSLHQVAKGLGFSFIIQCIFRTDLL